MNAVLLEKLQERTARRWPERMAMSIRWNANFSGFVPKDFGMVPAALYPTANVLPFVNLLMQERFQDVHLAAACQVFGVDVDPVVECKTVSTQQVPSQTTDVVGIKRNRRGRKLSIEKSNVEPDLPYRHIRAQIGILPILGDCGMLSDRSVERTVPICD